MVGRLVKTLWQPGVVGRKWLTSSIMILGERLTGFCSLVVSSAVEEFKLEDFAKCIINSRSENFSHHLI